MKIPEVLPENCNILYRADCKEALQNLIDRKLYVDLIYLDPPFNSNQVYNIIYKDDKGEVTASEKAFSDTWTYTRETRQMLEVFKQNLEANNSISPVVKNFLRIWIESLDSMSNKDRKMIAYLVYMAERLVLCHKILKNTGSIYYHCDPTASHYIKIIMDGIFGNENFRNEIIWCYTRMSSRGQRQLSRAHDIILWYSKGKEWTFNVDDIRLPYAEGSKNREGHTLNKLGSGYSKEGKTVLNPIGKFPEDWINIPYLRGKEYLGYKTQKPMKLLDRIVKASSNKGDVVLDPFCGCGTTIEVSQKLGRRWIGIDINLNALNIIESRRISGIKHENYDGNPETRSEYEKLTPLKKQDYLIERVGGMPSEKHSGDGGVDGTLKVYLGVKEGKERAGDLIFSVKTGEQKDPKILRELLGTMQSQKADMGILILEAEPSEEVYLEAKKQGQIEIVIKDIGINKYDKVQIILADKLIDIRNSELENEVKKYRPRSMNEVKFFRENVLFNS